MEQVHAHLEKVRQVYEPGTSVAPLQKSHTGRTWTGVLLLQVVGIQLSQPHSQPRLQWASQVHGELTAYCVGSEPHYRAANIASQPQSQPAIASQRHNQPA